MAQHRSARTAVSIRIPVSRLTAGGLATGGRDRVAVEEPMELRVGLPAVSDDGLVSLAVTMRTPGHDFELAAGFLVTEGIVADPDHIGRMAYCDLPDGEEQQFNIVTARLTVPVDLDAHRRNVYTTSSCGVCGKASIDAVHVVCPQLPRLGAVDGAVVTGLPDRLRRHQKLFDDTGGVHAAGLFTAAGDVVVVREDVGRHNAVDKVVGWGVVHKRVPFDDLVLAVSGRAGFEIVQKAAVAGIGMVVAVSAPTSLAIDAASRLGVTLVGFTREGRAVVYSGAERVESAAGHEPGTTSPDS